MHIYFSGIGGAGVGPAALIAHQAGYDVSGSDKQDSHYIEYLKAHGIKDIHIGQSEEQIAAVHQNRPIDWFVYTPALTRENAQPAEMLFCEKHNIKTSKREEFINKILADKHLKLIAIAGTHGKTTTTAMVVWLFKQLSMPVSYSLGAKTSFAEMGNYDPASEYFVYECDEFERHFLAFHPYLAVISGIAWDHHEIYATEHDYLQAFSNFIAQSKQTVLWQEDADKLNLPGGSYAVESYANPSIQQIQLTGLYNRRDGWLATRSVSSITDKPAEELLPLISKFPGLSRRFEKIIENLYSDYAHTPEKIKGAMSVAYEQAQSKNQKIVVVYEPLTNRRMHYTAKNHHSVFAGASAIYWVPSYMAREDPALAILSPAELIKNLEPGLQAVAKPAELDEQLKENIKRHLQAGDLVLCLSGGGGGSLDEWIRREFQPSKA